MTRTIAPLLAIVAVIGALFAGTSSAAAAVSCESTVVGAYGATLPGDNFQGVDGDQCSPATGGPAGVGATDWEDLSAADLSGENGLTLADNPTGTIADLGQLGND